MQSSIAVFALGALVSSGSLSNPAQDRGVPLDLQNWSLSGGTSNLIGEGFKVEIAVSVPYSGRAESGRFVFFAGAIAPTDRLFADDFE